MRRLKLPLLLALACAMVMATGLSGCSGGLRTEPTTSTLPAGAVAPTLPGAAEAASTTTTVLGAQSGNAPGVASSSTTAGSGATTTTRRAGGTTSTTGG
jgi:hypothetical protein